MVLHKLNQIDRGDGRHSQPSWHTESSRSLASYDQSLYPSSHAHNVVILQDPSECNTPPSYLLTDDVHAHTIRGAQAWPKLTTSSQAKRHQFERTSEDRKYDFYCSSCLATQSMPATHLVPYLLHFLFPFLPRFARSQRFDDGCLLITSRMKFNTLTPSTSLAAIPHAPTCTRGRHVVRTANAFRTMPMVKNMCPSISLSMPPY